MTRVALDLLGGDRAPGSVLDGALLAVEQAPDLELLLVGPVDLAQRLLADRGQSGRFRVVPASELVEMDERPARAVREKSDATVAVAARLVRDGEADAVVSVGSTGAVLSAAVLELGRLDGIRRAPLAAVVPSRTGPLVLLDVGATVDATPEVLVQFALAGAAFAGIRLGLPSPRVGLLTIGEEKGKGDALRKAAYELLADLPLDFVGNVEGRDVPCGGKADVVVTDGFTGNVLGKGLEGAATRLSELLREALTSDPEREQAARLLMPAVEEATSSLSADGLGGGVLLGVRGVVVVGHGASGAAGVAGCVATAVQAVREGLVARTAQALTELLDQASRRVTS